MNVKRKNKNNKIAKILEESGISLVSDLLDSDMDSLLNLNGIDEQALDSIYESVQNFVERKIKAPFPSKNQGYPLYFLSGSGPG